MSADKSNITRASELTAANLRSVAKTISAQQLSRLTLPEIEAVVQLVSKIMPAGNVPGMILSGLARLPGRRIPVQKLQQDVTALFSGVEQILDSAVYGAFFAGPAAILWGYQHLLKLAGKDTESAFPEGMWQFYVDYALREDTARHTNETHGFDTLLAQNNIKLDKVDRLTAWFMASVSCLQQYPTLLENEWRERVAISLLESTLRNGGIETQRAKKIHREWELKRPYRREADGAQYDYPAYRRKKFDEFLQSRLQTMPELVYAAWEAGFNTALEQGLRAYQRQMSIVSYLEPGPYGETRVPFDLSDAKIGIIHKDSYFLLPVCDELGRPLDVMTIRAQIASLLNTSFVTPSQIASLAKIKRSALANLRSKLNPVLVNDLDNLKFAPILISTDTRSRALPLSELRQTERGVGSHALTIFDTGESFVFDQSHIFFDGAWGTALSEIMTNEALSWARYLSLLPSPVQPEMRLYTSLTLQLSPADLDLVHEAPKVMPEVGVETDKVDLKACMSLRKDFKQRNDRIELTVNDLLVTLRGSTMQSATLEVQEGATWKTLTSTATYDLGAIERRATLERRIRVTPPTEAPAISGAAFTLVPAGADGEWLLRFSSDKAGTFTARLSVPGREVPLKATATEFPAPHPLITPAAGSLDPAQQVKVQVRFAEPAKLTTVGILRLTFSSAWPLAAPDDPAISFLPKLERTINFRVTEGASLADFSGADFVTLQTGTTAGLITVSAEIGSTVEVAQYRLDSLPVTLTASKASVASGNAEVLLTGFDNTRSITRASFTFYLKSGQPASPGRLDADITENFRAFFRNNATGAFQLRAGFPVSGTVTELDGVEVELINSQGARQTGRLRFE